MTHEQPAPESAGRGGRIAIVILSSLTAILVVAAVVVGVQLYGAVNGGATATPSASATPSATEAAPEATPEDTVTPSAEPTVPAGIALPSRCEDIYSASMLANVGATYGTVETNPVDRVSTKDSVLAPLVSTLGGLGCAWGTNGDAGGINTSVSDVDSQTAATVTDRLVAAGFSCAVVDNGQICRQSEGSYGETHFVGGGIWVATFWSVFGPAGYTEDIAQTLLS